MARGAYTSGDCERLNWRDIRLLLQSWGALSAIGVELSANPGAGDFTEDVTPAVRMPSRCGEKSPALCPYTP
jgi:hypothetical protein